MTRRSAISSAQAVERIWLIKQPHALGLALDEVADLFAISPDDVFACADLATRVRSKTAELDDEFHATTQLRASLDRLLCECFRDENRRSTLSCRRVRCGART